MELQERSQMDPQYQWDLSSLYENDAAWEADFASAPTLIEKTAAFQGKLTGAAKVRACLDASTELTRRLDNLLTYAQLRQSEDTRSTKAQELWARGMALAVQAESHTSFVNPEILSLPEATLREIAASQECAPYRFLLQQLLDEKPHVLSAECEQLIAGFGEVLNAPKEIANALQDADLTFAPARDSDGKEHEVTQANYILLQQSSDRALRKSAFQSFYQGFSAHNNTFAQTYSGIVKSWTAQAAARHYDSSRSMSLAEEHIPASVYDGLVAAVRRHLPDMYRYLALRKKMLGLDDLHYYDVYVPLTGGDSHVYSYDEAKEMVLRAVAPLGRTYQDTVRDAFQSRWIDVYPNKGKRGGAFSSGTYDSIPYILMSYTGDYESVSTVAHEMGHSMHTWFTKHHQPVQYGNYTLFVAEVASTVNENLLIDSLLHQTDDPAERLFLLNQYLEGFKGTVFRQTMFAEFERDAHAMAEQGQALTPQALNELYRRLIVDYFGPELVVDDEVQYEWSRIPHFYRPFYAYKYATSYSAAVALSGRILREGEPAVKKYLEFLSMGSSAYPLDELAHAGVDMTTEAPIDAALDKFGQILDEAEQCVRQLNR